jgi:hypothetical protein
MGACRSLRKLIVRSSVVRQVRRVISTGAERMIDTLTQAGGAWPEAPWLPFPCHTDLSVSRLGSHPHCCRPQGGGLSRLWGRLDSTSGDHGAVYSALHNPSTDKWRRASVVHGSIDVLYTAAAHSTLCMALCTINFTPHDALFSRRDIVGCALYIVHCTVHCAPGTALYTVHGTVPEMLSSSVQVFGGRPVRRSTALHSTLRYVRDNTWAPCRSLSDTLIARPDLD